MKKLIFVFTVWIFMGRTANAQSALDLIKDHYHIYFFDDFNYPCPSYPSTAFQGSDIVGAVGSGMTTVVGKRFRESWAIDDSNIWDAHSREYMDKANVVMADYSILRIKSQSLPSPTTKWVKNKRTGAVHSELADYSSGCFSSTVDDDLPGPHNRFGYGIFEICLKTHLATANAAFWLGPGPGPTEIDVPDVISDAGGRYNVGNWGTAAGGVGPPLSGANVFDTHPFGYSSGWDFSDDYHVFSCVWTPSSVAFYLDGNFSNSVPYSEVRTFANSDLFNNPGDPNALFKYGMQMILWTWNKDGALTTGNDNYVDIDWIKVWKPSCRPDIHITNPLSYYPGIFDDPFITKDLLRSSNIFFNYSSGTSGVLSQYEPLYPAVILEAPSTTILPNFIADQSSLIHSMKTVTMYDASGHSYTAESSLINNGYFEIIPIACDTDNVYYRQPSDNNVGNEGTSLLNIAAETSNIANEQIANSYAQIQVFPNPINDKINITYPCRSAGKLQISIKDVSGRMRYAESVACDQGGNVQYTVDASNMEAGMYFIELTLNDQHVVKKIVKL